MCFMTMTDVDDDFCSVLIKMLLRVKLHEILQIYIWLKRTSLRGLLRQ